MRLPKEQEEMLKEKRQDFNDLLVRTNTSRETQIYSALNITSSLKQLILTVSLTVGIAIIPLVLLATDISQEYQIFLKLGSMVLLTNTLILLFHLKKEAENFAYYAHVRGLEEKKDIIKFRNLFTKSLLTGNLDYFYEYNRVSRRYAKDTTDGLLNSKDGIKLDTIMDIAVGLLIVGLIMIIRPLLSIVPLKYYIVLTTLVVFVLAYYLHMQKQKGQEQVTVISEKANLAYKEEADINDFIEEIIKGDNNGDGTSKSTTRKKTS